MRPETRLRRPTCYKLLCMTAYEGPETGQDCWRTTRADDLNKQVCLDALACTEDH